jgi:hypothetical protein
MCGGSSAKAGLFRETLNRMKISMTMFRKMPIFLVITTPLQSGNNPIDELDVCSFLDFPFPGT